MPTSIPDSIEALMTSNIAAFEESFDAAMSAENVLSSGIIYNPTDLSGGSHGQSSDFLQWPSMQDATDGVPDVEAVPFVDLRKKYRLFKAPISFTRSDAADDRFGKWAGLMAQAGIEAARFPVERAVKILTGTTEQKKCWTGQSLISSSHSIKGTTLDNAVGATISSTTAMTNADVTEVVDLMDSTMQSFTDYAGRPIGVKPNAYIVPTLHGNAFFRGLNGVSVSDGAGGVAFPDAGMNRVERVSGGRLLWSCPYLSDTTKIYAMYVSPTSSPLTFVTREEVNVDETRPDEYAAVMEERIFQTPRMRGVEFAGSPYHIVEVTVST